MAYALQTAVGILSPEEDAFPGHCSEGWGGSLGAIICLVPPVPQPSATTSQNSLHVAWVSLPGACENATSLQQLSEFAAPQQCKEDPMG